MFKPISQYESFDSSNNNFNILNIKISKKSISSLYDDEQSQSLLRDS